MSAKAEPARASAPPPVVAPLGAPKPEVERTRTVDEPTAAARALPPHAAAKVVASPTATTPSAAVGALGDGAPSARGVIAFVLLLLVGLPTTYALFSRARPAENAAPPPIASTQVPDNVRDFIIESDAPFASATVDGARRVDVRADRVTVTLGPGDAIYDVDLVYAGDRRARVTLTFDGPRARYVRAPAIPSAAASGSERAQRFPRVPKVVALPSASAAPAPSSELHASPYRR